MSRISYPLINPVILSVFASWQAAVCFCNRRKAAKDHCQNDKDHRLCDENHALRDEDLALCGEDYCLCDEDYCCDEDHHLCDEDSLLCDEEHLLRDKEHLLYDKENRQNRPFLEPQYCQQVRDRQRRLSLRRRQSSSGRRPSSLPRRPCSLRRRPWSRSLRRSCPASAIAIGCDSRISVLTRRSSPAAERLSALPNGRLLYRLKRRAIAATQCRARHRGPVASRSAQSCKAVQSWVQSWTPIVFPPLFSQPRAGSEGGNSGCPALPALFRFVIETVGVQICRFVIETVGVQICRRAPATVVPLCYRNSGCPNLTVGVQICQI